MRCYVKWWHLDLKEGRVTAAAAAAASVLTRFRPFPHAREYVLQSKDCALLLVAHLRLFILQVSVYPCGHVRRSVRETMTVRHMCLK